MPTKVTADGRARMHGFVSRLQVVAGRFCDASVSDLLDHFDQLTHDIPPVTTRVEQLAVADLLQAALQQLLRAVNCKLTVPPVHDLDQGTFREALVRIRAMHSDHRGLRILEFCEILERRYAEADLSVAKVATDLHLSRWHLTRTLIRRTGHGFPWHLHAERTRCAAELLAQSTLSVKEISARVGYSRTSQLDRHFRQIIGVTPSRYRETRPTAERRTAA